MKNVFFFLLLFLVPFQSWATCDVYSWRANYASWSSSCGDGYLVNNCGGCEVAGSVCDYSGNCHPVVISNPNSNRRCRWIGDAPSGQAGTFWTSYSYMSCSTQDELDSVYCEQYPLADGCATPCDSTQWNCITTTEHSQTTIASDKIECFGGDCFGGIYCEYLATTTTECRNDCGQITTQTTSVPIRYEGNCNQDNLTDDEELKFVESVSG